MKRSDRIGVGNSAGADAFSFMASVSTKKDETKVLYFDDRLA
jgi:hypothetical protein